MQNNKCPTFISIAVWLKKKFQRKQLWGWGQKDGSVAIGAGCQALWPDFDPQFHMVEGEGIDSLKLSSEGQTDRQSHTPNKIDRQIDR